MVDHNANRNNEGKGVRERKKKAKAILKVKGSNTTPGLQVSKVESIE